MKKFIYLYLLPVLMLVSCNSSQKIIYFQDLVPQESQEIVNLNTIRLQPLDQISIVVSCKDLELAAIFNLLEASKRLSANNVKTGSIVGQMDSSNGVACYTVDSKGDIDFPVLGTIHVAGLTREEVSSKIKHLLVEKNYIKEPVVTVEFVNLYVSVLGEVLRPGTYTISGDRVTILDALSQAGDLTIYGLRDRVHVIRETNGKRETHTVDLRSKELFNSPVYYLQQNDVIYVEPNSTRVGQASVNENNWKSVGLWISIASFLMSAAVLIFK